MLKRYENVKIKKQSISAKNEFNNTYIDKNAKSVLLKRCFRDIFNI